MKNRALKTLILFNGIFVFASSLFGPLYAVFVEGIEKDILSISLSWAAYLVSMTVFLVIVSRYGDRVMEKEFLLLAGYLVRAVAWISFSFVSSIETLIVVQILLGLGEAMGTPAYRAIFAEHLDDGKYMGQYTGEKLAFNTVGVVAVVLGGLVVKTFGFNILFYIMGTLAMVSFFGVLIKPRELL